MTSHNYLLFVVASFALVLVPGPDMAYMLARSIAQGRRAGMLAAVGFNLGAYVHLTAALLGLSAILAASSMAFTAVKWAGAAYLVYLGIGALRNKGGALTLAGTDATARNDRTILWQAFLSDVLNPKVAMFFLALLPQFVDATAPHPTLQILLLGLTVNVIALPTNMLLVLCAARLTRSLRRNAALSRWLHRTLGALFIALGLRLVAEKA